MDAKEFERIFNNVKFSDVNLINLYIDAKTKEEKLFAKSIVGAGRRKSCEGVSKECSFFGDKHNKYAMLKHKQVVTKCSGQFENDKQVIKFNDWLISKGFNIPKLYTLFYADQHYYEIFDKAVGKEVYLVGYKNVFTHALGEDSKDEMALIKPSLIQKIKINRYLYSFNIKNQKVLMNLPQEKFDELFKQYKMLYDMGFHTLDTHAGNLMVSENGFTMIDLDIERSLKNIAFKLPEYDDNLGLADNAIKFYESGKKVPYPFLTPNMEKDAIDDICLNFLFPFCMSRFHENFLNNQQRQKLYDNDMKILTKAVNAITNNKIKFDLEDSRTRNEILYCLNNNMEDYYKVCDSQDKLSNQHAQGLEKV